MARALQEPELVTQLAVWETQQEHERAEQQLPGEPPALLRQALVALVAQSAPAEPRVSSAQLSRQLPWLAVRQQRPLPQQHRLRLVPGWRDGLWPRRLPGWSWSEFSFP